jgi:putative ABC transport system permease protein
MFRTTLKDLAARKLRLLTTSLAVLLGVAFMAGTLVLTDTIGRSFDDLFASANAGTDVQVRHRAAFDDQEMGAQRARVDLALADRIGAVDGVAAAEGWVQAYAQVVAPDGKALGNPQMGPPTYGMAWLTDDGLNPYDLAEGRAPRADREVAIDRGTAKEGGLRVGDRIQVLTKAGSKPETVVGITTFAGQDSPGGAQITLFTPHAAQAWLTEPGKVDAIKVAAEPGVSDEELAHRIERVVPSGTEVLTGAQITAEDQKEMRDNLQFFNTFLVVFAVVALFVGSFIIFNSFSILVAQRGREMALLRALGASRRQVLGSVLLEAAVVGLAASAVGLVAGIGVAAGIKALFESMGIDIPSGAVVVSSRTVVASLAAGLGVSVASAVLPARRAARIAPIAALRDTVGEAVGSGRRRVATGLGLAGLGAAAMAAGMFGDAGPGPVGLGALAVFLGVAVLGPVLARPLARVIGFPLARLRGTSGHLARENAMRNPKRTSATAAALMIGVALVGFITILAASTKASMHENVQRSFTGDLVVDSGSFGNGGLSPELAQRLSKVPEVSAVTGVRMTSAEIDGSPSPVFGADARALPRVLDLGVTDGSLADLGPGTVAVSEAKATGRGWAVGDTIAVRFAETGTQRLRVAAVYTDADLTGDYFVDLPTFEANVADQFDLKVAVDLADGVSTERGRAAVERVAEAFPQAKVYDGAQLAEASTAQIDTMLNLIYALLGLAVVIALLGIANTLALSIFERTRELGLLRAVGMTRRQLRTTVRYEAVIIALLGTALGLVVGLGFGWALVKALSSKGIGAFTVPVGQLATVVAIAAVSGVGAAILPARRASRLDVLRAIGAD